MSNTSNTHAPTRTFSAANPIRFSLYNANQEPALFVEDHPNGPNHVFSLALDNVSGKSLYLKNPSVGQPASASLYHFIVRFRTGILSDATLQALALDSVSNSNGQRTSDDNPSAWQISKPTLDASGRWYNIYLLNDISEWTFVAGDSFALNLNNMSAGGRGGSRGTQVELLSNQQSIFFDAASAIGLNETMIEHINVVNHRGKKQSPLHAGFVGSTSNMVLNDGVTQNSLTLRISNMDKNATLPLPANAQPKFILSMQTGNPTDKWALVSPGQGGSIAINGTEVTSSVGKLGQSAGFEINHTTVSNLPTELKPHGEAGDHFDVEFNNIVTKHLSGTANVYVRYENIPGYWDGQFVCLVQKSPLLYYSQAAGDNRVGIGTSKPTAPLHVGPSISIQNLWVNDLKKAAFTDLADHSGIWITKDDANTDFTGGAWLNLHNENKEVEKNGALITFSTRSNEDATNYVAAGIRGIFEHKAPGYVSGELAFYATNGATTKFAEVMRLTKDAKVGIGTSTPAEKLEVAGNIKATGSVTIDGNVGTSAPTSSAKLAVGGDIHATGKIQLKGSQQLIFSNEDTSNNLRIQLWEGYGLGINPGVIFYKGYSHVWKDAQDNQRMRLKDDVGLEIESGGLHIKSGAVTVGGKAPFIVVSYNSLTQHQKSEGSSMETEFFYSEYSAFIVGFEVNGDIDEDGRQNPLFMVRMKKNYRTKMWSVTFGVGYDGSGNRDKPEFHIDILFVSKEFMNDERDNRL